MASRQHSDWLYRLAIIAVICTFALIGMGGLVTSREAGYAVPDWPTSFGYNMFLLPFSQWLGKFGVFEEHSHRLMASLVGLITAVIAGWIWVRESTGIPRRVALGVIAVTLLLMGVRTQPMFIAMACLALGAVGLAVVKIACNPKALRWWASLVYSLVIIQGVLGGLRVTQHKDQIGVLHGVLAQVFLITLGLLALFNSRWWKESRAAKNINDLVPRVVRSHFFYATVLIFLQLIIGATMRHQHAGLPVWDFPKAHGQWWPSTDATSLSSYNAERSLLQKRLHADGKILDANGNPSVFLSTGKSIQANHVTLHMAHRVMAVLVLGLIVGTAILTRKKLGAGHALSKIALLWLGLTLIQALLGVLTVLKYKPADIATLHVLAGAGLLLIGALGATISRTRELPAIVDEPASEVTGDQAASRLKGVRL